MKKEYNLIKTVHINKNKNAITDEYTDNIEDTTINNLKELYRFGLKKYGRCISKIYIDNKEGKASHIGYVFIKKLKYEDCNEYFLSETWISLEHYIETVEREYLAIN